MTICAPALGKAAELFALAEPDLDKFVAIQVKEAKSSLTPPARVYSVVELRPLLLVLAGGFLGRQTVRAIGGPLGRLNGVMVNITGAN